MLQPIFRPQPFNPNPPLNNNPNFYTPVPSPQEPILRGKYFRDGKIAQWSGLVLILSLLFIVVNVTRS